MNPQSLITLSQRCQQQGVSLIWVPMLLFVSNGVAPTIHEIASGTGHRPESMTGLLDNMENKGMVKRTPCATDHRKTRITLTEKGSRLLGKLMEGLP